MEGERGEGEGEKKDAFRGTPFVMGARRRREGGRRKRREGEEARTNRAISPRRKTGNQKGKRSSYFGFHFLCDNLRKLDRTQVSS